LTVSYLFFLTAERPRRGSNSGGTILLQRTPRNKKITHRSLVFVERTLLKYLRLQSSQSSSPLWSRECSALQTWTTHGTKPLAFGLAKLSTHALKTGLRMEVENMPSTPWPNISAPSFGTQKRCSKQNRFLNSKATQAEHQMHADTTAGESTYHRT
jgi:hypothetical protein